VLCFAAAGFPDFLSNCPFIFIHMPARAFLFDQSQAGCFHVVNRIYDRKYLLDAEGKDLLLKLVRAYEDVLGVEVLTHCTMSNHFHILVRVPERPEDSESGGGPSMEALLVRLEAAVGAEQMKQIRQNLRLWEQNGAADLIEAWRQRQIGAMYSLSEYMKRVKQRFTRWYNRRTGRVGILWEDRYRSTIVQDEEKALRMMGTYIDLNPVRAGITDDPGNYRWSGYAEAMAGKTAAQEGLARITGATAERILGRGLGQPAPEETPGQRKRRHLKALIHYRQMLGIAGRPRTSADGSVVRRGVSEKVQARLQRETGVRHELLRQRVRHFTQGVIFGSREFIDEWFTRNRDWFGGASREGRQTGARSIGKGWKGFYNLRQLKQ
jgi:REP element-mobilizing transposase RayT